ncbi:uncharacterized protein N7483_011114 [Penicillium malachiteum]|uniref:uncharacterized protein n=1 Tax=Penicillium malachiteum TaxID=1324776 RepID=UPI002547F152|nr:uncharacterized protein N7483_011114 [Penicillium malachiteum]KAJ5713933.1 hypothetical protein N7483_011114 [Penicillium malachiteum]
MCKLLPPPSSACSSTPESPSSSDIEGQFSEHQNSTFNSAASPLSRQSVIDDTRSRQNDECESPYVAISSIHLSSSTNQQQGKDFKSYHFTSAASQQSIPGNQNFGDSNNTSHDNDAYFPTNLSPDSGMEEALNDDAFEAFNPSPEPDPPLSIDLWQRLSIDWLQRYGWEIDDMLQQNHAPSLDPPPSTDWGQQYAWIFDDMLQQNSAPRLDPTPSTDWGQQYVWTIDDILQQNHAPNSLDRPPSTDWGQQYVWTVDDIPRQGHSSSPSFA